MFEFVDLLLQLLLKVVINNITLWHYETCEYIYRR